jgi:four helix bundle protein
MLVIDIHKMTLHKLPKFELYEEGSQIRRSIKSVKSNIVEGYGRKRYTKEYMKFMIYALSSNDETLDHLENLKSTESLKDKEIYYNLYDRIDMLGRKINKFIKSIELRQTS